MNRILRHIALFPGTCKINCSATTMTFTSTHNLISHPLKHFINHLPHKSQSSTTLFPLSPLKRIAAMSRYAVVHLFTNAPGDARPTALQIIEDEGLTGRLTDEVFLIIGVSFRIGIETLRAFYANVAHVIGTVRDMEKGRRVVEEIERSNASQGKIDLVLMDQTSLESVKAGAAKVKKLTDKLNVAVFNAGYACLPPPSYLHSH